jgi:hypothetical protein
MNIYNVYMKTVISDCKLIVIEGSSTPDEKMKALTVLCLLGQKNDKKNSKPIEGIISSSVEYILCSATNQLRIVTKSLQKSSMLHKDTYIMNINIICITLYYTYFRCIIIYNNSSTSWCCTNFANNINGYK